MIVIKIQGRLGNQLFQYATAYALAKKYNTYVVLDFLDYNLFVQNSNGEITKVRIFFLNEYNIIAKHGSCIIFPQKYYKKVDTIFYLATKIHIPTKLVLFCKYYLKRRYYFKTFYDFRVQDGYSDNYVQSLFHLGKNVYLDGYFQCYKFFEEYRDDILNQYTLCNPLSTYSLEQEKIIQSKKQSVGIHIRRTDVVNAGDLVSIDYYLVAIERMQKKILDAHYFFFSDDPAWVKKQASRFSHIQFTIMDGNAIDRGHEDLYLLSKCKHQIIANSTFSWWGAWLNTNKDKIVMFPYIPVHKKNTHILNDIDVPREWIKIAV